MYHSPKYWTKKNLTAFSLIPLSWVYQLIACMRTVLTRPYKGSTPCICIGNVTLGGAGKTPTAIAIAKLLPKTNITFLSKGHGGQLNEPTLIDTKTHEASDVGDEPLLLAKHHQTIIAKNRIEGLRHIPAKTKLVIMDDGLQNPTIHKDVSFMVIDGSYGLGNGFTFPAGPLREPFRQALKRCQGVILIGKDEHHINKHITCPIFHAQICTSLPKALEHQNIIAFAGIARPEKFFESLLSHTCDLLKTTAFPDHHPYSKKDLKTLLEQARKQKAILVTTEKDYVRLPKRYQKHVHTLPMHIEFRAPKKLQSFILSTIKTNT